MAHGFPDYVTSRLKRLKAPQFRNVTQDIVRTAEGQMPVQRHFNVYDRSGYHRPQSDYQGPVEYQEPSPWFEDMDRMMAKGAHFVREAGESLFLHMEKMAQDQAYHPDPVTLELYAFFLEQLHQYEHEQTYQGQLERMEDPHEMMFDQNMGQEPLDVESMGMQNEIHGQMMQILDSLASGPSEEMSQAPGFDPVSEPQPSVHMEEGSLEDLVQGPREPAADSTMTLEELILSAMPPEEPNPEPGTDDLMQMFFPGMGPG